MSDTREKTKITVSINPGICGFPCRIHVDKKEARTVSISISDTECEKIQKLSELLTELGLKEVFMPMTKNPVFVSAQESGCHASCPIPTGIVKAAEVALGVALPKKVTIHFES